MTVSESDVDELTGLPSREALTELQGLFDSRPHRDVWSVAIVDIDHFKLINDVYGHLNGDRVLKRVADLVSRNTRRADTALRFGGDEFVVVMPSTEHLKALNQAERILEDVREAEFPQDMSVSISLGVADSLPNEESIESVLKRADLALHQAKEGGRAKISFYEELSPEVAGREVSFDHFVNRQKELRALRSSVDDSLEQGDRMVLVTGEPGVGKSRLVSELRHYCRFKGCFFLTTKYDRRRVEKPYAGIAAMVNEAVTELDRDTRKDLSETMGPLLRRSAKLLPALEPSGLRPPIEEREALKEALFSDLSVLTRAVAEEGPLVMQLDDLQWAPEPDLELLTHLLLACTDSTLLVVGTMNGSLSEHPPVRQAVEVVSKLVPFLALELDNLEDEYAGHMVMFALRDPHIPPEVLSLLLERSGGNPLFLRQLLVYLWEEGAITTREGGGWDYDLGAERNLPRSVKQVVDRRLKGLDENSGRILRVSSLARGEFTLAQLSKVTGEPEMSVARALEPPLKMGLLWEFSGEDGLPAYRFSHDAIREFLEEKLSGSERKRLSKSFARLYQAPDD
ncbi:diguanylate cyclase [Candidatus Fermentibacteria bacterium]|nr:diguanylate cyclase [Candidatus Fermentibacteria bacterium]